VIALEFVKGAALLLSLTILQSFLLRIWRKGTLPWQVSSGLLFGAITLVGMALPLHLLPGVIFDPRSVILSVAGFWGGPLTGLIAGAMAAGYRFWIGGIGAPTGIAIIFGAVACGVVFRELHKRYNLSTGPLAMLTFGVAVHIFVVLWFFTLPGDAAWHVLPRVALPNILIFSPAVMLLGLLLADIDQRLSTETSLRDSEARYRQLVDNAEISIWDEDFSEVLPYMEEIRRAGVQDLRVHLAGNPHLVEEFARRLKINTVNAHTLKLFGAESEADFIDNLRRTLLAETRISLVDLLCAIWDGQEGYQGISRFRTLDGGREVAVIVSMPIPKRAEDFRHIPVSHIDITSQLQAEEEILRLNRELELRVTQRTAELEAANREMETFAYTVSHDLRGPLQVIDGYSELLAEKLEDRLDEKERKYLSNLRRGCANMARLIDGLLELSRSTRGKLVREWTNLSELAEETAASLRETAPGRQVDIRIAPDIEALADVRMMRAVFDNLMGNAWKFTEGKEGARIEVGCRRGAQGDRLRVYVRDNGAGFDGSRAGDLFQPFKRLHNDGKFPGTGIGLSTVQRIIHRHGGTVGAEGTEGQGATVWFEI